MPPLAERVAIVTGAGTGIGRAIAHRLATDGASLVLAGLDAEELRAVQHQVGVESAVVFAGDLARPGVSEELISAALQAYGRIDILVNNAGGGVIRPTLEHTEATLQQTIDNNLWTTLRTTLAVLPHLVERAYGRIINVGAESVRNGLTDHAVYNAAKGGVHGLASGLAREFAGRGITVNVVAPSYTRNDALDAALAAGAVPERMRTVVDDAVALIPLGRPAEVEEVAATVAYLARDDARFVTGQVISVNGGSSMG